jgi:hypothetical protein
MVNKDNTIQIYGQIIQLPPSKIVLSLANKKVDVCLLEDNHIFVVYKNSVIVESKLYKNNTTIEREFEIENLLNQREYAAINNKASS